LQLTLPLPRPENSPIELFNGFPSGHSVAVMGLAWVIFEAHPRFGLLWFISAVLIALTRIDAGYH
jgi:membrane-associated phospholipid phosphatase